MRTMNIIRREEMTRMPYVTISVICTLKSLSTNAKVGTTKSTRSRCRSMKSSAACNRSEAALLSTCLTRVIMRVPSLG